MMCFERKTDKDSIEDLEVPNNCYGYKKEGILYIIGREVSREQACEFENFNVASSIKECKCERIAVNSFGTFLLDESDVVIPEESIKRKLD